MSELERDHKDDSDDGLGGDPLPRIVAAGLLDAALVLARQVEVDAEDIGRFGREHP